MLTSFTKKLIVIVIVLSFSVSTRSEQKRKGRKKTYKNKPKTIKKVALGTYISIITLNVNGLNEIGRASCRERV